MFNVYVNLSSSDEESEIINIRLERRVLRSNLNPLELPESR